MREGLSHAEQDLRDESYMNGLCALPRFIGGFSAEALKHQIEVGRLMRVNLVAHFPHMRALFNALPELEKV